MFKNPSDIHFWPFLILSLVLLSCSLLNSVGTIDVHTWVRWTQDYLDYGPFAGYGHNKTDYPPLMIFIFYLFAKGLAPFGTTSLVAIKLAILFFSLLATFLIFYWSKNYVLTALFHLSFIINSVCLGYADVIFGCFLIAALWQLHKNRLALFAIIFTLLIFIKWQALIILPFLLLYVFLHNKQKHQHPLETMQKILLPFLAVSGAILYAFGVSEIYNAFTWAFHHRWLSGNALNIHWVFTFLYEVFSPESYGGLTRGEISYIGTENPPLIFVLAKTLFIAGYSYVLLAFSRVRASFENLLAFSLAGYLLYFTFNTGVHENHLFLALMLALLLTNINASRISLTVYIALAFNINMLLFYGLDGHFNFSRVILGLFDSTLVFALLNTLVFSYASYALVCADKNLRPTNDPSPPG